MELLKWTTTLAQHTQYLPSQSRTNGQDGSVLSISTSTFCVYNRNVDQSVKSLFLPVLKKPSENAHFLNTFLIALRVKFRVRLKYYHWQLPVFQTLLIGNLGVLRNVVWNTEIYTCIAGLRLLRKYRRCVLDIFQFRSHCN